jgi:hypothetical protein
MLIKEIPTQMLEKTFVDIKELITFVYDNQIITEV